MTSGAVAGALDGCTVVVTRERPGEMARLLDGLGATVVHVPLIRVSDAGPEQSERLAAALRSPLDWLVVTSVAGADRVSSIASRPEVRLAAVGTATAERLARVAQRAVDVVPTRQMAAALVDEFDAVQSEPARILVAQADRAAPTLVDGLVERGHDVEAVTAYRTELRRPSPDELVEIERADAVAFASGSAASGWAEAFGPDASSKLPAIVVAIGPVTATVAADAGLKVTHVSADHSVDGLIRTLVEAWRSRPSA